MAKFIQRCGALLFIALPLLAVARQHHLPPTSMPNDYFNSKIYFGGMGGYTNTKTKFRNTLNGNQVVSTTRNSGFIGGLLAGVQFHHQRFYIASEIFGFLNTASSVNQAISGLEIQRTAAQGGFGLHILPGIMITSNAAMFIITGVEHDHFGIRINHQIESTGVTGGDLGIGARIAITPNTAIRVQYEHIFLGAIPLVGATFDQLKPSVNRAELIISVTPKIIRDVLE